MDKITKEIKKAKKEAKISHLEYLKSISRPSNEKDMTLDNWGIDEANFHLVIA